MDDKSSAAGKWLAPRSSAGHQQLVAAEKPAKPMSDEAIVKAPAAQGVKVAHRTVAKYREQLGILPSRLRKSF